MADDYNGTPVPENQNPEPGNGDQNDKIPDWMKEAGWETSSGTFDESKPVFDDLDDDEDEIVPADIPAWLEDAAPEGFSSDPNATPAFEGLDVDEPFITTGDLVPPPSMQTPAEEDQPEKPAKVSDPSEFDIPSWLENLELDEDSQETAVAWLENMPESLRASEEELKQVEKFQTEEPETIEEPIDELAWVDEIDLEPGQSLPGTEDDQAALSEDLIASELIPEASEPDQIFKQDEIESMESELPSWLRDLGDDQSEKSAQNELGTDLPTEEMDQPPESQEDDMPDWLRLTEEPEVAEALKSPAIHPASDDEPEIPDWLDNFEGDAAETADLAENLSWLDDLSSEEAAAEEIDTVPSEDIVEETQVEEPSLSEVIADETPQSEPPALSEESPQTEEVSPNDETLNAQVPDWLSKLGTGELKEQEFERSDILGKGEEYTPSPSEDDFDTSTSWLNQISEEPLETSQDEIPSHDGEEMDWLDATEALPTESSDDEFADLQESLTDVNPEEILPVDLESEKYFTPEELAEEEKSDDLPDWLSELREDEDDDQSLSLEEAIRQTDHDLNDAEIDFLSKVEEKEEDEADWLSKLDQVESQPDQKPTSPAIELEPLEVEELPGEESPPEPIVSGGMLERLKDTAEFKDKEDVPQWLEDIKEEEDPQETAVLWLQQFVTQGDNVDINNEIKRYTDELDPGDSIPKWMEDLKNEEDPQTTAMLWLERLSASRQTQVAPEPSPSKEDDSGWLADLDREAAESSSDLETEEVKDFSDPDKGWLADLEIDEKLKAADEDMPEWSKTEGKPEGTLSEVDPPWMKATSPLEGDFYTDELTGGEDKEVEIPEWLAGYADGERPEEAQEDESKAEEEYTWLSAADTPGTPSTPLDLNRAAISQLEGILGISHQIAKGIVTYREKHGPYHTFSDLKNVPEITDEQTIDILKPEVFISVPPQEEEPPAVIPVSKPEPAPPKHKPAKKAAMPGNFEEMLSTARSRLSERLINEATEQYGLLIKKKKYLDEIIEDLQKASLDHPLEISIQQSLGDAFMQKDMLDEALEAYSKAEDLLS
ncbi:MAG TPA: hypothetical protein ENF27_03960 [Chloroflexi bacterium]|nr:MAG: hypothetical protein DRI65_03010 [Chloroflexota bacterium]HDN05072.1 hypothetical protein [Chloroflexota bacterium]